MKNNLNGSEQKRSLTSSSKLKDNKKTAHSVLNTKKLSKKQKKDHSIQNNPGTQNTG